MLCRNMTYHVRKSEEYFAQPLLVNAAVFKGFVQATQSSLKKRRERQLGKRVRLRLGQQRIYRIEQSIRRSGKTPVDERSESLAMC
jgi:hypothetical protein